MNIKKILNFFYVIPYVVTIMIDILCWPFIRIAIKSYKFIFKSIINTTVFYTIILSIVLFFIDLKYSHIEGFWGNILAEAHGLIFDLILVAIILEYLKNKSKGSELDLKIINHRKENNAQTKNELLLELKQYVNHRTYTQVIDFSNLNLEDVNFSNLNLSKSSFTNSNLKNANFYKAILIECDFTNANIETANFNNSNLWFATFVNTQGLKTASFTNKVYQDEWTGCFFHFPITTKYTYLLMPFDTLTNSLKKFIKKK